MANISRVRNRKRNKGEICRLIAPKPAELRKHVEPLNLCVRDESTELPTTTAGATATTTTTTTQTEPSEQGVSGSVRHPRRRKKRSAIFLPPEKLTDNAVSICKFKFVAGNQPRLQEKKVLSVDSGGNFRFFPERKEPLPDTRAGPSKESPSTCAAEKKPLPDLLPIAAVQHSSGRKSWATTASATAAKKMSRRQKIEQTFGEKGFLIQTQHVPATEGSAFCKFRQLKKFTRYLYRSWRHYLPEGEVNQPTEG